MDHGKPPDTNVVRLRRNGDPSDEERERLAGTIFAEQDEIGTFSRGNLVPPAPSAPPPNHEPSAADPFFEQLQTPASGAERRAAAAACDSDATAAYFERLGSQTPAEMSQSIAPHSAAAAMPGSATLPGELTTSRRRRSRRGRAVASSPRLGLSILRPRVAAPPLLAALGALVVAGAALAAIIGGGEHGAPAAKRLASQHASAPSSHLSALLIPAHPKAAVSRSAVRHHSASRQTSRRDPRHLAHKAHVVLAADRRRAHGTSSSSAGLTPADQIPSQTVQQSPVVEQPAAAPVADTTGSSGSSASSGASSRPAFGANGTLGPGHSPNG
jgi:hypothetical protein